MAAVTCQISDLSHADREVLERLLGEPLDDQAELTIVSVASSGRSKNRGQGNPYSSPQAAPLRTRFKNPADKWAALGLAGMGLMLAALCVVRVVLHHRISGLFMGAAIGLMVVGWLKYSLSTRIVE